MNSTIVSDDQSTARVSGGALLRQVFAALDPYGLAYAGGRVGQVGMGGFTLSGGTSVLAARYGWALDHVMDYEVSNCGHGTGILLIQNQPGQRKRNVFATLTHYSSIQLGRQSVEILKNLVKARNLTLLNPQLITYSIPAATMELSKVRGGNALGLNFQGHLTGRSKLFSSSQGH
ncbi:hypothetical protein MY10362_009868 [Beauveria mimosiformis]